MPTDEALSFGHLLGALVVSVSLAAIGALLTGALLMLSGRFALSTKLGYWKCYLTALIAGTISMMSFLLLIFIESRVSTMHEAVVVYSGIPLGFLSLWGVSAVHHKLSVGHAFIASLSTHLMLGIIVGTPVFLVVALLSWLMAGT